MPTDGADGDGWTLAPDEAFSLLGNETRVQILEALADAEDPLSFSALHEQVDLRDSGQFNYHLDKLVGYFVESTDEGYDLRRAGSRVVEAILSGAVTDDPVIDRTPVESVCHLCGAPVEISFRHERVAAFCTECAGVYPGDHVPESADVPAEYGFLGYLHLPPAGVQDRTPTEVHRAARTWNLSERLPAASGVCPRCSATVQMNVNLCQDHDRAADLCPTCGNRYEVGHYIRCTNCPFSQAGVFSLALLGNQELLDFLTTHGINPISPDSERLNEVIMDYEEEVHGRDPLDARFTFTADGDSLTLTLEDAGDVAEVVPRSERREE
ncbi:MAG: helix-turn-helix domain-containing protein [Haloarculaceae archaeon]